MQRQQNLIIDLIRGADGLQNLNTNASDKHFQQLVLQKFSELLPTKQMQIHNNYKIKNNMNISDKHFQQLLLQQIA